VSSFPVICFEFLIACISLSSDRHAAYTFAPLASNARAYLYPTPKLDPVMTVTFPVRSGMTCSLNSAPLSQYYILQAKVTIVMSAYKSIG
jgi:hypothetical protein